MLAMYAAFLATGHAIALKLIKSGTVTKDIGDIANFLRNFANDQSSNIHKVGKTIAHQNSSITKEMKRFEDEPNHQEPWTLHLQTQLLEYCKDEPPDSIAPCVSNLYAIGLHSGDRRVEWGQK